jgi:hypothetical protein
METGRPQNEYNVKPDGTLIPRQTLDYESIRHQPYASHLPIIDSVYRAIRPSMDHNPICLELGAGMFSTGYFAQHASNLLSIECTSMEWADEVKSKFGHHHNVTIHTDIAPHAEVGLMLQMIAKGKRFDIVFCDGCAGLRHINFYLATRLSQIVIAHDSEEVTSWYQSTPLPDGWGMLEVQDYQPWTVLMTSVPGLIDEVKSNFSRTWASEDPKSVASKPLATLYGVRLIP